MQTMTVADVMTTEVVTVTPTTAVKDIIDLLAVHAISAVPVLDPLGTLVGVVSDADLLRHFLRADADIKADIDRDVLGRTMKANMTMVRATVEHGVVMLTGQLEYETDVALAVRLCGSVPGVVQVTNRLGYIWNGQGTHREDPAEATA